MAIPHKGEGEITVGGKTYRLVFSINNLCEAEVVLGLTIEQIFRRLDGLNEVRALLWAGLRTHHPEVNLIGAGEIVEVMGGAGPALDVLGSALMGAMPEAKGGDGSRPRKGAGAGTGRRSLSRGSKSAKTPKPSGEQPPAN